MSTGTARCTFIQIIRLAFRRRNHDNSRNIAEELEDMQDYCPVSTTMDQYAPLEYLAETVIRNYSKRPDRTKLTHNPRKDQK